MFKITNGMASRLLSPVVRGLFEDNTRKFPVAIAYKLNRAISKVQTEMEQYRNEYQKIIKSNGGVVNQKDGAITYKTQADSFKAIGEVAILDAVEIEVNADRVPMESLPDLSLAEVNVLEGLLYEENDTTSDSDTAV